MQAFNLLIAIVALFLVAEGASELLRIPLGRKTANESSADMINLINVMASGNVVINNLQNTEYYGPGQIGTPAQNFQFIFATGSADTWIGSTKCGSSCKGHPLYNPSASSTAVAGSASYNEGHVTGVYAQDTVTIGGIPAKNANFVELTGSSDPAYSTGKFDGTLGLGFQAKSSANLPPVFQTMISEQAVTTGQFAFYFSGQQGWPGELTVGGYDTNHFSGDIAWNPVKDPTAWSVELLGIVADNVNYMAPGGATASVATETSFFIVPNSIILAFQKKMELRKFETTWILNCHAEKTYPDIEFIIGGKPYALSAADYSIPTGELCMFAFMAIDESTYIIGDLFMRKYYTVFDYENKKIGFATANQWSEEGPDASKETN